MQRKLDYFVKPDEEGMTILSFLKKQGFSRHVLASMKSDREAILLNNSRGFGRTPLQTGDHLQIHLTDVIPSEHIVPSPMSLDILYEDEDILVLNKPSDTPVHPSIGNFDNTLANGVAYYYAQQGEIFVYRCINRLDRDTTGALILAKNALSAAVLSEQMQQRRIHRTYLAVVEGTLPREGTIDAPISRIEASLILRGVDFERGEHAVTHYRCLAVKDGYSLAELHLETGRTHQIRVHMKYIGHPLPGDYLYNPNYEKFSRQPLHSYQLSFIHPITKKPMLLTAPVPEDFRDAFQHL